MNTLTFLAPSGAPASGTIIEQLDPPGSTSGANYVGFFGAGGPQDIPFAVIVGSYQDRTFITNTSGYNLGVEPYGLLESGRLFNHKFIDSTNANVDGDPVELTNVPASSGTVLIKFEPSGSTPVITQNTLLRTVVLNASSGIDDQTSVVTGIDVRCYEPGNDGSWTNTAGTAALDNRLFITDHNTSALRHDFFVGLSASPEAVGERNDWGFFCIIEFL